MLGRLDAAFASQRHFVANASHELRTPLAIMRTEVDVALAPDLIRQVRVAVPGVPDLGHHVARLPTFRVAGPGVVSA